MNINNICESHYFRISNIIKIPQIFTVKFTFAEFIRFILLHIFTYSHKFLSWLLLIKIGFWIKLGTLFFYYIAALNHLRHHEYQLSIFSPAFFPLSMHLLFRGECISKYLKNSNINRNYNIINYLMGSIDNSFYYRWKCSVSGVISCR